MIRLYNSAGLIFTTCLQDAQTDEEFSEAEKLIGSGFNKPEVQPLDTPNRDVAVYGTVKDLGAATYPYKVRLWLLVEYEPEKL